MPRVSKQHDQPKETQTVVEHRIQTAILEVPLGSPEGFCAPHIDVTFDHHPNLRQALHSMREGLRAQMATLADGRPVASGHDVVRWMFERVAEQRIASDRPN